MEEDIDNAEVFMEFINEIINDDSVKISFKEKRTLRGEIGWLKDVIKLMDQKKMIQMVAFQNSQVIGMSDITLLKERKSHVGDFGIALTKRSRGHKTGFILAKATMERGIDFFEGQLKMIRVCFPASKDQVKNFYKNLGFVEVARIPDQYLFDKLEAETVMIKKIDLSKRR